MCECECGDDGNKDGDNDGGCGDNNEEDAKRDQWLEMNSSSIVWSVFSMFFYRSIPDDADSDEMARVLELFFHR